MSVIGPAGHGHGGQKQCPRELDKTIKLFTIRASLMVGHGLGWA